MRGFTLVELVIVIAIVGIAAACIIGQVFGKEESNFMRECSQHEEHYQCQIKWKQMHPEPIVVYAPFNK